jgi:hypothetical protein
MSQQSITYNKKSIVIEISARASSTSLGRNMHALTMIGKALEED